jgi:hypothetical protein
MKVSVEDETRHEELFGSMAEEKGDEVERG